MGHQTYRGNHRYQVAQEFLFNPIPNLVIREDAGGEGWKPFLFLPMLLAALSPIPK